LISRSVGVAAVTPAVVFPPVTDTVPIVAVPYTIENAAASPVVFVVVPVPSANVEPKVTVFVDPVVPESVNV
jgi:hypothetical protein